MHTKDGRVDAYIARFSEEQQSRMRALRALIHETVPLVRETIKYGIPTFLLAGNLLSYHTSKGAIQFPLDRPLPMDLIRRIILFRVEENLQMQAKREGKR